MTLISESVGNKQKGRISKQVFQENKVSQIFVCLITEEM